MYCNEFFLQKTKSQRIEIKYVCLIFILKIKQTVCIINQINSFNSQKFVDKKRFYLSVVDWMFEVFLFIRLMPVYYCRYRYRSRNLDQWNSNLAITIC